MKERYYTRLSDNVALFVEEIAKQRKWTTSFTINELLSELLEQNKERIA
jgi:hypothetical protein|nr:MAG TPA: Ribbon-helix-helix domain [Caudoviricetes sp.]